MASALQDHPAPLPFLQLAASRLWEKRDPSLRVLSRKSLEELGGVGGVLAAHAEDVWRQLPGKLEEDLAREMLMQLITPDRTKRPLTREELLQPFDDRGAANRVLEHLIRGRLLVSSKTDDGARIELAHDSLVLHWHRYQSWLGEDVELRKFRNRV